MRMMSARPALLGPRAAPLADVHAGRHRDAGARHRREHGDLQRRPRRGAPGAAQPRSGPPGSAVGEERQAADPALLGVGAELLLVEGTRRPRSRKWARGGPTCPPSPPAASRNVCRGWTSPGRSCRCWVSRQSPAARSQPDEDQVGRPRVVLLAESIWRSRLGGDPDGRRQTDRARRHPAHRHRHRLGSRLDPPHQSHRRRSRPIWRVRTGPITSRPSSRA